MPCPFPSRGSPGRPLLTLLAGLCATLASATGSAQVNTDALRPGPAHPGLGGGFDVSILRLGGNVELLDVGFGGRMQVLALSAALALEDAVYSRDPAAWRVDILAAGTDGRDGPTDATGAIVDASVPSLARRNGRKPERDLATGRSWFSLDRAEALLRTGPTGTNVMDVVAVLIERN